MPRLFLIRHARTKVDPNAPSSAWRLEPGAKGACEDLARTLTGAGLKRVVTSDMARAEETGQLIADYCAFQRT